MAKFFVELWGSHPDENNDDCWTGMDFDTKEAAEGKFEEWKKYGDGQYVTIGQLGGRSIRVERTAQPLAKSEDSREWQREMAMEAGMLHGMDAYNDMMGY